FSARDSRRYPCARPGAPCAQPRITLLPTLHQVRSYQPGDGIMSAELTPHRSRGNLIDMTPSYRLLMRLFMLIPAVGLFLLVSANPFAQSTKLPAPSTHVSDFAGVIDGETRNRIESLLQKLQDKSKVELYVATVDGTGGQEIAEFSKQLAADWNLGSKTSRTKSVLLVVSVGSKTSFTQISRAVQTSLPEGVVGEMGYRMTGPLGDGRFAEAIDSGIHVFANALAEKIGFKVSDLEAAPVASNSPEVAV